MGWADGDLRSVLGKRGRESGGQGGWIRRPGLCGEKQSWHLLVPLGRFHQKLLTAP